MGCWGVFGLVCLPLPLKYNYLIGNLENIDSNLHRTQKSYSTYHPLKVLICSWNVDAARPAALSGTGERNAEFLRELLLGSGASGASAGANIGGKDGRDGPPDVIVFGFQEIIDLENKKLTASMSFLYLSSQ